MGKNSDFIEKIAAINSLNLRDIDDASLGQVGFALADTHITRKPRVAEVRCDRHNDRCIKTAAIKTVMLEDESRTAAPRLRASRSGK
jgi:hypothetical protein